MKYSISYGECVVGESKLVAYGLVVVTIVMIKLSNYRTVGLLLIKYFSISDSFIIN